MPSISTLIRTSFLTVQAVLATTLQSPVRRFSTVDLAASESCPHPQLSCHNTTVVKNLCCFNAPGGSLLQTQFWDTNPVTGPEDSWTIHGLWPDNCDGSYPSHCAPSRNHQNITAILKSFDKTSLLSYMTTYWVSDEGSANSFWAHEWNKHGTCISTLNPDCYANYEPTEEVAAFFQTVVNLYKTLPTYGWLADAGIKPSTSKTYTLAAMQAALKKHHGYDVYLGCSDGETLDEAWYYFNVRGSVQTGEFVGAKPTQSSSCPSSGIKYPPKSS